MLHKCKGSYCFEDDVKDNPNFHDSREGRISRYPTGSQSDRQKQNQFDDSFQQKKHSVMHIL